MLGSTATIGSNKLLIRQESLCIAHTVDPLLWSVCERERVYVRDEVGQGRVALSQPTARCDSIGLVLKLLWSHLIEILETDTQQKECIYSTHTQHRKGECLYMCV